MKIGIDKYFKFTLKFKNTFSNATTNFNQKEFLIIKFEIDKHYFPYGEVNLASDSNPQNIINELVSLLSDLPENPADCIEYIKTMKIEDSLRFGLEQALLFYLLKKKNLYYRPLTELRTLNVNAIIDLTDIDAALKKIATKVNADYSVIKIKAGRDNFNDDLKLLKSISSLYGEKIILRLDVNGKWDYNAALDRLPSLEKFNIEYIEDPTCSLDDNLKLANNSKVHIALDQTLPDFNETLDILQNYDIKHIVVKPSIRFGIFKTIDLINYARKLNKQTVISSAFETTLGKSVLTFIASFTMPESVHGLDVYDMLETSFYDPFPIKKGKIEFDFSALDKNFEEVFRSIETNWKNYID
ncbi:enolase C-terminal domain-like protein [Melioribacter sp. OK-6-Me]|uniref:enolase C-terminal domain-like protein n=1 Tax=unclassified Melioribacter TaxID=2627329 RepID=UPI003EDB2FBC